LHCRKTSIENKKNPKTSGFVTNK